MTQWWAMTAFEIPPQREGETGKDEMENKPVWFFFCMCGGFVLLCEGNDDNQVVLCSRPNILDEEPSLRSIMLIHSHKTTKEISWQNYKPGGYSLP